jgi:hypothetical protein
MILAVCLSGRFQISKEAFSPDAYNHNRGTLLI